MFIVLYKNEAMSFYMNRQKENSHQKGALLFEVDESVMVSDIVEWEGRLFKTDWAVGPIKDTNWLDF